MICTKTLALIKRGERTQHWDIFSGGEKEHRRKMLPALSCCYLSQVKEKKKMSESSIKGYKVNVVGGPPSFRWNLFWRDTKKSRWKVKKSKPKTPACVNFSKAGGLWRDFPYAPCHWAMKECLTHAWAATPYFLFAVAEQQCPWHFFFFLSNNGRLLKSGNSEATGAACLNPNTTQHNTALTPTWVKVPHIRRLSCGCIATAGTLRQRRSGCFLFVFFFTREHFMM